jgi:NAD(P)-dependent dehydrogenase (short-subunit alcohol dehydrogenase family)/rhamnose utilization protein RhaD (predicted bifunctional aldolase and dehydrogenase)
MTTAGQGDELTWALMRVCHRFGGPDYARAGGGNASLKRAGVLHIKPSGTRLATLTADDLVPVDLGVLLDTLASAEADQVDGDPVMVAAARARIGRDDGRRPSVELFFHALMPEALVLHLHPLTLNAVTCNEGAVDLAARLLGEDAVVVDYVDPGLPLARAIIAAREAYTARTGNPPPGLTLLRNHGIIAAADSEAELIALVDKATRAVEAALDATPVPPAPPLDADRQRAVIGAVAPRLRGLLSTGPALAVVASDSSELVRSTPADQPLLTSGPLIPDQIVYAGSLPLVLDLGQDLADAHERVTQAVAQYVASHGQPPVIVVVPDIAAFAAGTDKAAADNALGVFTDALRVARDADRLGRVRTLDPQQYGFIETWEAEAYRRSIATRPMTGRLHGQVAVVTGAAQGFGLGLATALAAEGAHVVLADLNRDLAEAEAQRLIDQHGPGRALAVGVDVADEVSQRDAMAEVAAHFGGLDLYVANAGIALAGSVLDQSVADFDLVTAVNYKGYFLGVRSVTPLLAAQHAVRPDRLFDIVEINSKSGLAGSQRNFAYAGSKFGGIGLTQSFALELIESGIKVNAVCPGNYLDGPLWSDPERGLFIQYLRAGKVPGATTVAEVRAFYEAKVPMGRGCLPADVAEAVLYIVAQSYETGQALPVTGGQIMLK